MASILRVNTLTDASSNNSTAMSTINQGTGKSWIQLNGVSFGTQDSFNIGSATDSGTGTYLFGFSSNFNNDDYAITATSRNTSVGGILIEAPQTVLSTSQYNVDCIARSNGALTDAHYVMTHIMGDLA